MRYLKASYVLIILILSVSFCSTYGLSMAEEGFPEMNEVPLWLVLHFRDYVTDMPVANVSISAAIYTNLGLKTVQSIRTNETGIIQVFFGNVGATPTNYGRLSEIKLSGNYTLIKVENILIEDISLSTLNYEAEYTLNFTEHLGLRIDLAYKDLGDRHLIEGDIWVLQGALVRVSNSDPITGEKQNLIVTPAIKTNVNGEVSEFEDYYFFPLDYEVTLYHKDKTLINYETKNLKYGEDPITPLIVKVDRNTTLINWMLHAVQEYVDRQEYHMNKEIEWLTSSGYPIDREYEEYQAIKNLLERSLELYEKAEYMSAFGGAKISDEKLSDLIKWLSNLEVLSVGTAVGISLFTYGLASLLSSFIFEEPTENKIRFISKVLIFSLAMLMFSLSHPSLKIAFTFIFGIKKISLPLSLLGGLTFGGLVYFIIQIFSVRKKTIFDLALQLGVRSLKRRLSRTLLTLITISLVVSSAIVFVNISMNRETRIKEQWKGSDISGVLIKPDTSLVPLSEYDINWTRTQEWCEDLGYMEEINSLSFALPDAIIYRIGMLIFGEEIYPVKIIGIDPIFIEEYYGFSEHIKGFWQEFSEGQQVVIVPTGLGIVTNELVTLTIEETIDKGPGFVEVIEKMFGEYRVVGTYDLQTAFTNMTKIDGTLLFEDDILSRLMVFIPIKSIIDPAMTISEVMIITKDGYEPIDIAEELAYTLAATTVANKDGVAQRVEWSTEFAVAGLMPYMAPLVIAGLMMYTTMVSVFEERRKEFTTLATLGLDPKNVFQSFLSEALLLGLIGTFIGFFGSYILGAGLYYLASAIGTQRLPIFPLSLSHWSMPAILVALLAGVVMVFLGGYIPAIKARGVSLMGRAKKRQMIGELVSEGDVTSFTLPLRETVHNGEMLYKYVRGTIGKIKMGLVDPHSIEGEIYRDGTFRVTFVAIGDSYSVTVPCKIKGIKEGDILVPVIEFPTSYKAYHRIREIIRNIEQHVIGYSSWKEMQLKMTIVREAPKKRKSTEEILAEIKGVISQIKDFNKKLMILEAQKGNLSAEVYKEFKEKYISLIEGKAKNLRSMTVNLEPYHKELQEGIEKIAVEVERITTAYNLGEIMEEEYVKTCGPLQAKLSELKDKVIELEDIFEFLKTPFGISYS